MKIKNLFFLLISIITLSSCTFTEEIHFKKDGSGNYTFRTDMSKMMEAMGDLGTENDSIKKENEPQKKDTLIIFKDVLENMKDSIKKLSNGERKMLESLKDFRMRIQMDEEKKQMNMDFMFDFDDIADLKNINEKVQKAQSINDKKKKNNPMSDVFSATTDVEYSFKNNFFKRSVKYKEGVTKEQLEKQNEKLKGGGQMFEESTYKIIYHFEDKIKSVSLKDAQISKDRKTLTLEMPMDTVIKNPFLLNFEVKLK